MNFDFEYSSKKNYSCWIFFYVLSESLFDALDVILSMSVLLYKQISKQQADSYREGQLPECHLHIKYVGSPLESDFPPELDYKVELQGARKPFNYFRIKLYIGTTSLV